MTPANKKHLLIINGDDAGIDPGGDASLLKLARLGVMKSVSLMANGLHLKSFIDPAQDLDMSLGLHFNLSDGRPSGGPYKTLTNKEGLFFAPKQLVWQKAAENQFDVEEVYTEVLAQWHVLEGLGVNVDHIDGHNHIHIFETIFQGLAQALANKEDLVFRIPEEPECPPELLPGLPDARLQAQSIRDRSPKNWFFTDRFIGYLFSVFPSEKGILHLSKPRPRATEWMVHPNQRPGSPFTTSQNRSQEMAFLASESLAQSLASWGYQLASFADMSLIRNNE